MGNKGRQNAIRQGTVLCVFGVTFLAGMSFEPTPAELHGERGKSVVYGFNVYESIDYLYVKIMEW